MRRLIVPSVLLATAALAAAAPLSGDPITVGSLVQNHEGTAVAGARVDLLPLPSNFEWARGVLEEGRVLGEPLDHTTTSGDGRFLLEAPGPGVFTVLVRAPGYVPVRHYPLALANATELPTAVLLRDETTHIELRAASSSPPAGVWVMAMTVKPAFWRGVAGDGWRVAARIARSDGSGRLTVPRAANEKLEVVAFPAGQAPVRHSGVEQRITMDLPAAASAPRAIRVHDESSQPLAGLVVSTGALSWPVGRTDPDGRLEVPFSTGSERIHLFAPDGRRHFVEIPEDPSSSLVEILFLRAARLTERVIDARTREPVAGALVWTGHDPGSFAISDSRGRYQLFDPGVGRFWIQAEAEGFLPQLVSLERGPGGTYRAPTLALEPASRIAGMAVDGADRPLPGVRIEARIVPAAARSRIFRLTASDSRALSDKAGGFQLGGLAEGGLYEVTANKPSFAPARVSVKTTSATSTTPPQPLRLVLTTARPAHGRVLDAQEQPLAGVEIAVFSSPPEDLATHRAGPPPDAGRATSDLAGRFELAALPGSPVDITATKRGFTALDVRRVKIPAGEGPADLGTLILIPGATLEGRVTGPDGDPIGRASVWITEDTGQAHVAEGLLRQEEPAALTGEQGRFLIEGLEAQRRLHLLIHREGYLSRTLLGIQVPQKKALRVGLERAAQIRGQVVDTAGEGIAKARVGVRARDLPPGTMDVRPGPEKESSVLTDATGYFTFLELEPGEAMIEAFAPGFQPSKRWPIDIPEGGTLEDLVVELERGALLRGQVTNTSGEPVAGARVLLERQSGRSNALGSYRIDGLPPGPQPLTVRHRGYEETRRTVDIDADENVADFVLEGGWSIAGRVVDEHGTPVAAAGVHLARRGPGGRYEYQATSGAEGRFVVPEAVAGRYDLDARKSGYVTAELTDACEIVDRSIEGLEVELLRGTTLAGEILGLSFEELAVVQVEAERGERLRPGTVDYEGRFEIADLGPGDWRVRAWLTGGSRETQALVSVEPGVPHLVRDLEFTGGLTLRGQIVYGGEPLPGTLVTANSLERVVRRSVVSDHEGNFLLADLEPGTYRLALTNARQLVTHYEDLELLEDRDVVLHIATAVVRGRVISATTEQAIDSALVYFQKLLGADATEPGPLLIVGTGPEGTFTVTRVSAGHHRLRVNKAGFTPHERLVELAVGEGLDLAIELEPSAGLDLLVRLASGTHPEHATVHVYEASSGRRLTSESRFLNADGSVRFETLPAGTWDLLVTAPGGVDTRTAATVPGSPLEVVLPAATRVGVRVPALVAANGMATLTLRNPEGQAFESMDPGGTSRSEWNLVAGVAAVESVPAGVWTLRVVAADGQVWQGTVATQGEGQVAVRLE